MKKKSTWTLQSNRQTPLEMYMQLIKEQRNSDLRFKYVAIISSVGFILSLLIILITVRLPKTAPLVITVSDWGEAKYIGSVNKLSYNGIKVPAVAIEYQIQRFVTNLHEISSDPNIVKRNLKDCYSCCTMASAQKLTNRLKENNPLEKFGRAYKTVKIESILQLTKDSYQVDFIVNISDRAESQVKRIRNRGVISIKLMEPAKEDQVKNPLGIYITDFDFKEIGEEK